MIIKSPQNPRLKALKRLTTRRERARSGHFLAEGEDLVLAAHEARREPIEGFCLVGSELDDSGFHELEPALMKDLSTLGSGTRVIAVYEQQWAQPVGPLCVYLHGVGDPGNVGTILRSAHAFGASCVALGPGCADPHSPKAVRASMGAIFSVALARAADVSELPGERVALVADAPEVLRGSGSGRHDVLATEADDAGVNASADARTGDDAAANEAGDAGLNAAGGPRTRDGALGEMTLLVGAERDGLPADLVAACERSARIPIATESLNAAMAATVALYEVTRARERAPASSRVRAS
jgi:TrmH family RNA methyltransferase